MMMLERDGLFHKEQKSSIYGRKQKKRVFVEAEHEFMRHPVSSSSLFRQLHEKRKREGKRGGENKSRSKRLSLFRNFHVISTIHDDNTLPFVIYWSLKSYESLSKMISLHIGQGCGVGGNCRYTCTRTVEKLYFVFLLIWFIGWYIM